MRAATVVQVLQDLFYVLLHVLFYLWSLLYNTTAGDPGRTRSISDGGAACPFSHLTIADKHNFPSPDLCVFLQIYNRRHRNKVSTFLRMIFFDRVFENNGVEQVGSLWVRPLGLRERRTHCGGHRRRRAEGHLPPPTPSSPQNRKNIFSVKYHVKFGYFC